MIVAVVFAIAPTLGNPAVMSSTRLAAYLSLLCLFHTAVAAEPIVSAALDAVAPGKRYDVCATCPNTELTSIPWNDLTPGSVVNVFHRSTPYRTKIALRIAGTAAAPVIINGVTGPAGERPVISGEDALTPKSNANSGIYSDEEPNNGEALALILIKRSHTKDQYGYKPKFIQLRNLELRDTYGKHFTAQNGANKPFAPWAAGIWADVVEDLLIDNVLITNHSFGVFINNRNANGGIDAETSRRITVRHSQIFGNGRAGSYLEHNLYLQGIGCVVEDNSIGTLRPGAAGSSYKDRCAGSVIRNNHINCAARCLDLVHDESSSNSSKRDSPTDTAPDYDVAVVTGNTIESSASISCIHFGGDNLGEGAGPFPTYRNGPLRFNDNQCTITGLPASDDWRAYVFDIQHTAGTVEASGNTIRFQVRQGSDSRAWVRAYGTVELGKNDAPGLLDASDRATAGDYHVIHH
jgi:hypothetical protein